MKATIPKCSSKIQGNPWALRLFVASDSPASAAAIVQAKYIIAEHLPEGSKLEIVDIVREIDTVAREQVLAIPTLVRVRPQPVRRIIGDLSDPQKVLTVLGVVH